MAWLLSAPHCVIHCLTMERWCQGPTRRAWWVACEPAMERARSVIISTSSCRAVKVNAYSAPSQAVSHKECMCSISCLHPGLYVCPCLQVVKAAVQEDFEAGHMLLPLSGSAMAAGGGQAVLDETMTPFTLVAQASVACRNTSASPQTADKAGRYQAVVRTV